MAGRCGGKVFYIESEHQKISVRLSRVELLLR